MVLAAAAGLSHENYVEAFQGTVWEIIMQRSLDTRKKQDFYRVLAASLVEIESAHDAMVPA